MRTPSQSQSEHHEFTVNPEEAGVRLDALLARRFSTHSRNILAKAIRDGKVAIGGLATLKIKPSLKVEAGMALSVDVPVFEESDAMAAPNIDLPVLFEDEHLVAFDKPAGLPTHAQRPDDTNSVASVMVAKYGRDLPHAPGDELRPGIIHRLDADTTGVIVCARTQVAFDNLKAQFRERGVHKTYLAIVLGVPRGGTFSVTAPLERDPQRPQAVRVNKTAGRPAHTDFEVIESFEDAGMSLVQAKPLTGRTHQIRMHLLHAGHPVIADKLYGARTPVAVKRPDLAAVAIAHLSRHALHAASLDFAHPVSGQAMHIESPLPADMAAALEVLRMRTT